MSKIKLVGVYVDTEIVSEALQLEMTHKVASRFIKNLDEDICDWAFTIDLYKHFAALKREHDRDCDVPVRIRSRRYRSKK